jgi:2-haloacid dehalogenase
MEEVRSGRIAFCKLDVLHRRNLEKVFSDLEVSRPDDGVLRNLNLAWHRLDAWPDVTDGLGRLKRRYLVAPVSNGNISLMVDLARRNGFVWDAMITSRSRVLISPQPRRSTLRRMSA